MALRGSSTFSDWSKRPSPVQDIKRTRIVFDAESPSWSDGASSETITFASIDLDKSFFSEHKAVLVNKDKEWADNITIHPRDFDEDVLSILLDRIGY